MFVFSKNGYEIEKYILFAVIMVGCFLRFFYLDINSLWSDEIFSLQVSDPALSFLQAAQMWRSDPGHPPVYYFLLYYYFDVFPYTPFYARALSAIFGVLGVGVTFLVLRNLWDKRTGLVGAALLAVHNYHFFYSQEVRSYALVYLFSALTLWFLIRANKKPDLVNTIFAGVFMALGCFTHYFGLLYTGLIFLSLLLVFRQRIFSDKRWVLYVGVIFAIVISPWAVWVLEDFSGTSQLWTDTMPLVKNTTFVVVQLLGGRWAALFLSLCVAYFIFSNKLTVKKQHYLFAFIASFLALAVLYSVMRFSVMIPRYYMVLLPCVIVAMAGVVCSLPASRVIVPCLLLIFAWPTFLADVNAFDRRGSGHNPKGLLHWVQEQQPVYPVVSNGHIQTLKKAYDVRTLDLKDFSSGFPEDRPFWVLEFHAVHGVEYHLKGYKFRILKQKKQNREAAYLVRLEGS